MMTVQATAALISSIGIILMICIFLFVLARSTQEAPYEDVQPGAYGIRKILFIVLSVGFIVVPALTLRSLPYSADPSGATIVDVTGHQGFWEISQTTLQANRPVVFRVGSADVNHGFAIYDDTNQIMAQVQAMPGYISELAVEFDRPGTYTIMCLEYCGLVHHGMFGVLTVANNEETL